MSDIAKHDTELEGESNNCKDSRVNFLVSRRPVGIHDTLEVFCELDC